MQEVWRLWRAGAPPHGGRGEGSNDALRRCFPSEPFRISAYIGEEDIGDPGLWVGAPRPWWWHYSQLLLLSSSRTDRFGYPKGAMYSITVPPEFKNLYRRFGGSWVVVTVRFNDPRAVNCRPAGPKSARMSKREAIAYCRGQLVLQSITPASGLPATDAPDPARGRPGDTPDGTLPLIAWAGLGAVIAVWRRSRQAHGG